MKTQRIEMRAPSHIKDAIRRAANLKGLTLNAFIVNAAYEEALKIINRFTKNNK